MANLTLSLDEDILQQAREAALRERTSVNALVREFLTNYVNSRGRRLEALAALDELAARSKSASSGTWSREDLHRR